MGKVKSSYIDNRKMHVEHFNQNLRPVKYLDSRSPKKTYLNNFESCNSAIVPYANTQLVHPQKLLKSWVPTLSAHAQLL